MKRVLLLAVAVLSLRHCAATPVSFIITSSGDVTVGSLFQLTCTVMGVVVDALIFWFGPRGQIGSSTDEIELGDIVQIGDMYSRTLTFNSLSAEQAGNYTCFNTATVSPSIQHYVFVANRSITVTDSPTLGQPFTATCEMVVPDNLEATVQVMLFDPAGQEVALATGLNSVEAVFLIASLQESDLGEYRCRSTVFSNQLNGPVIAEQSFSVVFQCVNNSTFCSGIMNSQCVDTAQGPACVCLRGYMLGLESQCVDIDECATIPGPCSPNDTCINTEGSFQCIASLTITSSGDVTAGSEFQLTCTVMGVTMYPMIMWLGPGGLIGSSTDEIELGDSVHSGDTYSRTLLFNSLSADQAANYICFNTATVPPSTDHFVFVANRSISVTDSPTPGRPFRATCEMVVPDNLEATVQVMLFDPAGQEVASATGLNSAEAVFLLASLQESDLGEYRCTSTVFSNQLNSPVIAERTFSVDMALCEDDSTFCSGIMNSECVDTAQGPICVCLRGYMLGLESQCVDIDECTAISSACSSNAMCINREGSFECIHLGVQRSSRTIITRS